jgi:hypothetical protein
MESRHGAVFEGRNDLFSGRPAQTPSISWMSLAGKRFLSFHRLGRKACLALLVRVVSLVKGLMVGQTLRSVVSATVHRAGQAVSSRKKNADRGCELFGDQPDLSEKFTARSTVPAPSDLEEDVCAQAFQRQRKRLARVLIKIWSIDESNPSSNFQELPRLTSRNPLRDGGNDTVACHSLHEHVPGKMGLIAYKGPSHGVR